MKIIVLKDTLGKKYFLWHIYIIFCTRIYYNLTIWVLYLDNLYFLKPENTFFLNPAVFFTKYQTNFNISLVVWLMLRTALFFECTSGCSGVGVDFVMWRFPLQEKKAPSHRAPPSLGGVQLFSCRGSWWS